LGRYGLFGVIIGKDGGCSDNIGGVIIGGLVGRGAEEDTQFQFHCCCCCQVHVFQALGFSILLSRKKKKWLQKIFTPVIGNLQTCNRAGDVMITKCFICCCCCYI